MTMTGMEVGAVRDLAARMRAGAESLEAASRELDAALSAAPWRGADAGSFTEEWRERHRGVLQDAAARLREAGRTLSVQADEQDRASGRDGVATPRFGLPLLIIPGPSINPVLKYLLGLFAPGTAADRDASREGSRASDDAARRNDSGRFPGRSFDNDWAGRQILANYLAGGPDMELDNDPQWTEYMQSIDMLKNGGEDDGRHYDGMQVRNDRQAQAALQQYLLSGQKTGSFDNTFSMAVPNGESITAVNYLHGTNADVGGFKHSGTSTVEPLPDGTYRVQMNVNYQWNDRIDPNLEYSSDEKKNSWAEIITLGRADPYDIHIGWSSATTVIVDAQGNVIRREGGWPA